MTVPMKVEAASPGEIMESVIVKGDLAKLEPGERANYYMKVCQSIGLNPLTRPLEYIMLNGKLTLYAKRDCADQLRKINGISIAIVSQDKTDDLLTVHVRAKDMNGREDEDLGVVNFPDSLRGEARANAILKAVTKAKRRVTLSISGLGFLDETEIEDIPASAKRPVAKPNVMLPPHDPVTGEVEVSPHEDKPAVEAAAPASPTNPQAGAADYIARWNNIMQGATNADQVAAKWNSEKDERAGIAWPKGEFITLKRKVERAIKSMREPIP